MTDRPSKSATYYLFLVATAGGAMVSAYLAKNAYELQPVLDRLPNHNASILPWYVHATMSVFWIIVLVASIRAKRVV